jgi:Tfp pilus assembly protein PilZ
MKAEKRIHKRYIKRCEIKFSSNGTIYSGISSNFSQNGLFIKTSKPFAIDNVINLTIYLPNGSIAALTGIVRRALRNSINMQNNGMGIELIEKDSNYSDFLKAIQDNTH